MPPRLRGYGEVMYNLVLYIPSDKRARSLEAMMASSPWIGSVDVERIRDREGLEARLDAGPGIDILISDTVLAEDDEEPTGIDLVREHVPVSGDTQIIYATEHAEYATKAYQTRHVYYLLEPIVQGELDDALSCAVHNLHAIVNRPISVRCGGKIQVVFPHRVAFVESDRRRCHIHMGDESLTTYATLDALAHELPSTFVRCHKSFLVNMRFIESVEGSVVKLFTGETLPVSQKRRKATADAFTEYVRNRRS